MFRVKHVLYYTGTGVPEKSRTPALALAPKFMLRVLLCIDLLRGGCRVFGWCRVVQVSDAVGVAVVLVSGAVGLGGVGSVSRAVGVVGL